MANTESSVSFKDFVTYDFDRNMEKTPYMVKQNVDEFHPIAHYRFETYEECLLAIALMIATPKDKFDLNDFSRTFKFTLRMIGNYKSKWAQ